MPQIIKESESRLKKQKKFIQRSKTVTKKNQKAVAKKTQLVPLTRTKKTAKIKSSPDWLL